MFPSSYQNEEREAEHKNVGPSLFIDYMAYRKIMHFVNKSNFEVSGLGKVLFDEESNTVRVIDIILLPQKNTQATTEIDEQAIAKAMFELKDAEGELRFWWHSHVDMATFWSHTDIETIERLSAGGWFVSSVFNQQESVRSCYSQNYPVKLFCDNIETSVEQISLEQDVINSWDKEYKENVKNVKLGSKNFNNKKKIKEVKDGYSLVRRIGGDPDFDYELVDDEEEYDKEEYSLFDSFPASKKTFSRY